ncbi:magnesium citrate secondary transporter [Pleomorphovibrio marinus]|uniref:magnesium citrate secondary transporter n=1 Tax=Pleomorphovibrio marinus TaxID=2164132 RepID=UPI001E4533E4|nr:magnesium citrate secondary transporter [Pleomorphovibrio marinus]
MERVEKIFLPYIHSYLDDLMAMPVILGVTLQVYRWIHPSRNLFVFTKTQIFVAFIYISLLFEVVLPWYSSTYIQDIWDVACYLAGAIYFHKFINISSNIEHGVGNSKGDD